MKYCARLETKQKGQIIKEDSPQFETKLEAEAWLHNCCRQAKELKIKVTDHFLYGVE